MYFVFLKQLNCIDIFSNIVAELVSKAKIVIKVFKCA